MFRRLVNGYSNYFVLRVSVCKQFADIAYNLQLRDIFITQFVIIVLLWDTGGETQRNTISSEPSFGFKYILAYFDRCS